MISILNGFEIGSANPIDKRFNLTKAEMLASKDSMMPPVYATICPEDSQIYVYNKNWSVDATTGKFRLYGASGSNTSYSAGTAITIDGNVIGVVVSTTEGNIIKVTENGLFASADTITYTGDTSINIDKDKTISVHVAGTDGNIIKSTADGLFASADTINYSAGTAIEINDKKIGVKVSKTKGNIVSALTDGIYASATTKDYSGSSTVEVSANTISAKISKVEGNVISALTDGLYASALTVSVSANTGVESGETLSSITVSGVSYLLNYVEKVTELPATSARTKGTVVNYLKDGKLYRLDEMTIKMDYNGGTYDFNEDDSDHAYYTNGSSKLYLDGFWDDYFYYDSEFTEPYADIDNDTSYEYFYYDRDNDILYVFNSDNIDEENVCIDPVKYYTSYRYSFQTFSKEYSQLEYDDTTITDKSIEVNLGDRTYPNWVTFTKKTINLLMYPAPDKTWKDYGKLYWKDIVNDEIYTVSQSIETCETPGYPRALFDVGDQYLDTVDNHGTHIYTKINVSETTVQSATTKDFKIIKGSSDTSDLSKEMPYVISANTEGIAYWDDTMEIILSPSTYSSWQSYRLELPINWHGMGYIRATGSTTPVMTFIFAGGNASVINVDNAGTVPSRLYKGYGSNIDKFILEFYGPKMIVLDVKGYKPSDTGKIYAPANVSSTLTFKPLNHVTQTFAYNGHTLSEYPAVNTYCIDNKCYSELAITGTSGTYTPTAKQWNEYTHLKATSSTSPNIIDISNHPTNTTKLTNFIIQNHGLSNAGVKVQKTVTTGSTTTNVYYLGTVTTYVTFPIHTSFNFIIGVGVAIGINGAGTYFFEESPCLLGGTNFGPTHFNNLTTIIIS